MPPPDLTSKYQAFIEAQGGDTSEDFLGEEEGEDGIEEAKRKRRQEEKEREEEREREEAEGRERSRDFFHAWVYVQITGAAFFVEASTGDRKQLDDPGYTRINCVFNQETIP